MIGLDNTVYWLLLILLIFFFPKGILDSVFERLISEEAWIPEIAEERRRCIPK